MNTARLGRKLGEESNCVSRGEITLKGNVLTAVWSRLPIAPMQVQNFDTHIRVI